MADILLFRPRPRPAVDRLAPQEQPDTWALIEEATYTALETAVRLIAILDRIDGDADREPGGDDKPSLGPREEQSNNIVWSRGTGRDLEIDQ